MVRNGFFVLNRFRSSFVFVDITENERDYFVLSALFYDRRCGFVYYAFDCYHNLQSLGICAVLCFDGLLSFRFSLLSLSLVEFD